MPITIYLDTNHWIKLGQIASGKINDTKYKKIYDKIIHLSKSGEVIFPASMFVIHELVKYHDQTKRETMLDLVVDISQGHFIEPVNLFHDKEIENAVMHRLKKDSIHNIQKEIIQKGLNHFAGIDLKKIFAKIDAKIPDTVPHEVIDEAKEGMTKDNEDLEKIKEYLKKPEIKEISYNALIGINKLIPKLEKLREERIEKLKKIDKNERKIILEGLLVLDIIEPLISKYLFKNNIPHIDVIPPSIGLEGMRALVDDMPSLSTFVKLVIQRYLNPERKIKSNDHWDLANFSGAIPYCDIFITEKMFAHMAKTENLDQKYGCKLFTDLLELDQLDIFSNCTL